MRGDALDRRRDLAARRTLHARPQERIHHHAGPLDVMRQAPPRPVAHRSRVIRPRLAYCFDRNWNSIAR
jgi:hypothetical protein